MSTSLASTELFPRPEGRLAVSVRGDGPLIVLIPGMGDLRSTWHQLTGPLEAAGYRTATLDLRGHGGSDTTFTVHGDIVTAEDVLALVEHLGGPAVLVGSSMGTAAAVWAAAERPDLVAGLVLVAPMLRERPMPRLAVATLHLAYRVLFTRPWGAALWTRYYRSVLARGAATPGLDAHLREIRASLREPGRLRSFRELTLQLDHSPIEPRLGEVQAPALTFVGALDPDYRDPAAELDWVTGSLARVGATGFLVPDVAHYPQNQAAEVVVAETLTFLSGLPRTPQAWTAPTAEPRA